MEFRPCIDIHNGKVKQIVGGTLSDQDDCAQENFVAAQDAAFYARLYQKDHIILLNPQQSAWYEADVAQASAALSAYPGGLQIGGGVTLENAGRYIEAGASHVIVTSYVFQDGRIRYDRLKKLSDTIGKKRTSGAGFKLPQGGRRILYCNRPLAEVYAGDRDGKAAG